MKKATLVPLIVFLLLTGGLFYLFTNFQINLFEGKITYQDEFYLKEMTKTTSYSLGDVVAGKASLDGKGWAIAFAAVAGLPLITALLVRFRIKRKERKKLLAVPNETQA